MVKYFLVGKCTILVSYVCLMFIRAHTYVSSYTFNLSIFLVIPLLTGDRAHERHIDKDMCLCIYLSSCSLNNNFLDLEIFLKIFGGCVCLISEHKRFL